MLTTHARICRIKALVFLRFSCASASSRCLARPVGLALLQLLPFADEQRPAEIAGDLLLGHREYLQMHVGELRRRFSRSHHEQ